MNPIDFEPFGLAVGSRYEASQEADYTDHTGKTVRYLRRRLLPRGEELKVLGEVEVQEGDRLDKLAHRTLGDPEQYWKICDANNVMKPEQLLERVGARVRIPGFDFGESS